MTTPNEELIAQLRGQAYTTCRPDQLCDQAADLLQSQAERIKELEAQKPVSYFCKWRDAMYGIAKLANERDILRAQLAAIAAAEPAYYLGGGRLYADKTRALFDNSKNAITELFTRPMPAQDVTELVEALERVLNCCDIAECSTVPNSPGALKNARTALANAKGAK